MKIQNPVSGEQLNALFSSPQGALRQTLALATSPAEAVRKIGLRYGVVPSISGHNVPDIVTLRDTLHVLDPSGRYASALMISAPHTHWDSVAPTIVECLGSHYVIGPKRAEPGRNYHPVSFALQPHGLVAYEWTGESVDLLASDIDECLELMTELCERADIQRDGTFGLSLNFRFKGLFDNDLVPNIENPLDTPPPGYLEASLIERIDGAEERGVRDAQQVSWHVFSDLRYRLSPAESRVLNLLRDLK